MRKLKLTEWKKNKIRGACFLFPSAAGVAIFFVLPFLVVIYYSLTDSTGSRFVYFQNFINVINNKAFQLAVGNTLKFSFTAVPLAIVFSMMLAVMLEARIPGASRFRTFFLSPMMVPVASIILIWQVLFNYNGTVNELVLALGGSRVDWLNSSYGMVVVVLLFLWKNLGYNMVLFMSALSNIPVPVIEAAQVDGASRAFIFFKLKLRYMSPTILFVGILSVINSFKIFREVYLLTGNYPYESVYMLQHFMNNMFRNLDYQRLSAAAVLTALFMCVLIAVMFLVEEHFGKDIEG